MSEARDGRGSIEILVELRQDLYRARAELEQLRLEARRRGSEVKRLQEECEGLRGKQEAALNHVQQTAARGMRRGALARGWRAWVDTWVEGGGRQRVLEAAQARAGKSAVELALEARHLSTRSIWREAARSGRIAADLEAADPHGCSSARALRLATRATPRGGVRADRGAGRRLTVAFDRGRLCGRRARAGDASGAAARASASHSGLAHVVFSVESSTGRRSSSPVAHNPAHRCESVRPQLAHATTGLSNAAPLEHARTTHALISDWRRSSSPAVRT